MSVDQSIHSKDETILFETISNDIIEKGYSITPNALPIDLTRLLLQQIMELPTENFKRAGIGTDKEHQINELIRTDEISWITNNSEAKIILVLRGGLRCFVLTNNITSSMGKSWIPS